MSLTAALSWKTSIEMILCWVYPYEKGKESGQKVSSKTATQPHSLSLHALGKPCPLLVPPMPFWQIM